MKELNSIIIEGKVAKVVPMGDDEKPYFGFRLENDYGTFECLTDMNRKVITPVADDKIRVVGRIEKGSIVGGLGQPGGNVFIIAEHIEIRVRLKR